MENRARTLGKLAVRWQLFLRLLERRQGYIWRGLLAWTVGVLIFYGDDLSSLDNRLQIRGNQKASTDIVLVTIAPHEISNPTGFLGLRNLPESGDISDGFFWNRQAWLQLLQTLLAAQPRSIAVTLFFPESILNSPMTPEEKAVFKDPRIVWAALNSANDRPVMPAFANDDSSNVASVEVLRDQDGVIRRITNISSSRDLTPIAEKISRVNSDNGKLPFINFRGDDKSYSEYSMSEVTDGDVSGQTLKNKIIFIGSEQRATSQYLTPLGLSSRHAVLAAMTDHLISGRSINRLRPLWYVAALVFIMIAVLYLMAQIPQSVAFIVLVWIATLWTALSIWVFDTFYFWLPISAVVGTIASSYIIFLGYQANEIERKHYRLKQEQDYLRELEQLKTNFVSLISHDLKTPIAKIQAILDRLMLRSPSEELLVDLSALRQSNDELNQYIQSILQMLKVEARDFRLHLDVGEVNELIQSAWKQLAPLADAKKISMTMDLEPMFTIEFDQTLIREVLVNILDNAIKYSPDGGSIHVHSTETDSEVRVEIRDSGQGIATDELPLIWGKFVRGKDQGLKTKGTGLGLYLVKFFIELHGGRVFIESKEGHGTKIGFALPIEGGTYEART